MWCSEMAVILNSFRSIWLASDFAEDNDVKQAVTILRQVFTHGTRSLVQDGGRIMKCKCCLSGGLLLMCHAHFEFRIKFSALKFCYLVSEATMYLGTQHLAA